MAKVRRSPGGREMTSDYGLGQHLWLEVQEYLEFLCWRYELVTIGPPHDIAKMVVDHLDEVGRENDAPKNGS